MENIAKIALSAATYGLDKPYDYKIPEELMGQVRPGMRVVVPFSRSNRRSEGIVLALESGGNLHKLKAISEVLDKEPVLHAEQIKLALFLRERFFCTVYEGAKAMLPAGLFYTLRHRYTLSKKMEKDVAYALAGRSAISKQILDAVCEGGGITDRELSDKMGAVAYFSQLQELLKKSILIRETTQSRKVGDKTIKILRLTGSAQEAMEISEKRKRRAPLQSAVLRLLSDVYEAEEKELRYFTGASGGTIKQLEKEGLIEREGREIFRSPLRHSGGGAALPELNGEQRAAYTGMAQLMKNGNAETALLYGVTGSGKTAVYIHLIAETLKMGKSAIILVPEIALTPQMVAVFTSHFGENIALLHSSLGQGERYDEWKRVHRGQAKVVIGTRSAVFAPVSNLGLLIIDEEQEHTYKSENTPRYHGRDVAKFRCFRSDALLVLGSATPAIESFYNAKHGIYHLFTLSTRYNEKQLPEVAVVDMKRELRQGNGTAISEELREALSETIKNGRQSILFINRRGDSSHITCGECGFTYACPRCSVSLTYHLANRRLLCHYCGFSQGELSDCPECGGKLKHVGAGTQKVQRQLEELFPGVKILRMDTDTVSPAKSHESLLSRFEREKIPILVGTQMVTKGLNFENVTLVGVILADLSLYGGDFRANERTFSLITQVVGRSGRGRAAGRAIIQTFTPQNEVIRLAAAQDYDGFYKREIGCRKMLGSPPIADLFGITASGLNEGEVLRAAGRLKWALEAYFKLQDGVSILGPAALPVVKVKNRYRYRVTVSCKANHAVREIIAHVIKQFSLDKQNRGVAIFADGYPLD